MSEEAQTYTVRLRERGQVTIPRVVREKLATADGDLLTLLQVDDLLLLVPRQTRAPALTEQFTTEMEKEDVSLADLLTGLAKEREAIHQARRDADA